MLKVLSSLLSRTGLGPFGQERQEIIDARKIYAKLMLQSRKPEFFGTDGFADSYDGRMEVLCVHLSAMHHVLRRHGIHGERLAQALYDVMIADFDVALREQALSDTAVDKRIKPLAKMYYERLESFKNLSASNVDQKNSEDYFSGLLFTSHQAKSAPNRIAYDDKIDGAKAELFAPMAQKLTRYTHELWIGLHQYSLGEIATAAFNLPKLD